MDQTKKKYEPEFYRDEKPETERKNNMNQTVPITNQTMELSEVKDKWFFDENYQVWCLEDILYTQKAKAPKFQRMSIFVPKEYMDVPGNIVPEGQHGSYTAQTAPVVFANNAAGYMQMPHTWLGGPRDESGKYLKEGMIYVTCGSRGRESRDADGKLCGKSPWTLVDLKTAIRFLRHNRAVLPGNPEHIISVGWSAGGAMSALLGVTGNHPDYLPYLEENGAFLEESDAVYGAQIYCPIIDLDHADIAYEWMFGADKENENSPAGPAGVMTEFQEALSAKLTAQYITYFNSLGLTDPSDGTLLLIHSDGRSGSGYEYLMKQLEASATDYLTRLDKGVLPKENSADGETPGYSVEDYLSGNYLRLVPAAPPERKKKDASLLAGHAGPGTALPDAPAGEDPHPDRPAGPPSLGNLVLRPPKGVPYRAMEFPMEKVPGTKKDAWLSWDGTHARIRDLDSYVLNHRRRMKPCTSFDTLGMDSGENQEFGTPERDYMHFSLGVETALQELKEAWPEECEKLLAEYKGIREDPQLALRKYLINPLNYIGKKTQGDPSVYYRIRVGASDADTSFMISLVLAVLLQNAGKQADYALIWDRPHCTADYPGEVCAWIHQICEKKQ